MKNPFTAVKESFTSIPIHRRFKYGILSTLAIITLIVVTVIAAIDVKKEEIIETADPIESYDKVTVIPVVFEDEETETEAEDPEFYEDTDFTETAADVG